MGDVRGHRRAHRHAQFVDTKGVDFTRHTTSEIVSLHNSGGNMSFPGPEFDPPMTPARRPDSSKKVPAGVCGILLGALGVHKFVLGYTAQGLIMLLTTLFTCGLAGIVWGIIGLIEGIIYLTKSDDEFAATYVVGKRGWF